MTEGKLWDWEDGAAVQLAENQTGSQPHFGVITVLLELLHDKVELTPLKRIKVNDRSATGFRASWDGRTADYYFDETTGLMVQSGFKWEPEAGKEFDSKTVFADYKEIDGVKFPHRRTTYIKGGEFRNYVLLTEFIVTDVRIADKLPEGTFSLPKEN